MDGSFACPECGNALELTGLAPGRQVRCDWCRTFVEVPFFPRAGRGDRRRHARRRERWVYWAWGALAVGALVLIAAGAGRVVRARSRQVHERAMARLCDQAREDERGGRYGPSLAAIEAAMIEAGRVAPGDDARIDELRRWRDRVGRREFEARLAGLAALAPEQAVGSCLTLRARLRDNPGLARYEEVVADRLDRSRERWVEADLSAARRALDGGRPAVVLDLCERLVETANTLPHEPRRRTRTEADSLVGRVVARGGLILGPIRGQFTLGTDASYAAALHPRLVDALRQHGYLPRPASSFWGPLWDEQAPYSLRIEVAESFAGLYQESQHRTSAIKVGLSLDRRGRGEPAWEGVVTASTRESLPNLGAYRASRLAVSDRRSPAVEHLLYEDARGIVADRLALKLRTIPDIRLPPATTPTHADGDDT